MTIYLVMLTFIGALAFWSVFLPARMRVVRFLLAAVGYGSVCLFIGLRDQVGPDWDTYETMFKMIEHLPLWASMIIAEPLYVMSNRVAALVGGDIHLVNLFCALVLTVSLYKFSRLVEIDPNLLLFISAPYLLFVVGMGYTRQSAAVGLCLVAAGYLRRNQPRKFYLLTFTAMLFHYSALFLLLLWWVNSVKRMAILGLGLLAASPLIYLMLSSDERYAQYVQSNSQLQSHGVWSRILLVLLGLAIIYTQRARWNREGKLRDLIIRCGVALVFLMILSVFLSTLADRLCLYLFFVYIAASGKIVRYAKPPFRYLSLLSLFSGTYAVFVVWFALSPLASIGWVPYHNVLF